MPLFLLLLLLAAAGASLSPAAGRNLSSVADLVALYNLRAALGLRARDWPRRSDPCSSWTGVGCDADGRVVSLNLHGLRRTRIGRRNPRFSVDGIQNLTRLTSFNATGFSLPGPIPDWLGPRLPPSLSVLDLRRASVSGGIPSSLGDAVGLVMLSFSDNSITGDIPLTLGQLRNLSFLDLSSNFLTGAIPPALGALSELKAVILSNNSLTGSIPPQLGDLSSLVSLDLSFNSLLGSLPDNLRYLKSLQNLNLGSNSLTGSLGTDLFSRLSKLQSITLSHNNISGLLPASLCSLPDLQFLDVSYNNLTGSLPGISRANVSPNGTAFNISNNMFYGSISSGFAVLLSRFNSVDISDNYLQGSVPVDSKSRKLSLGSNCFLISPRQRNQAECKEFYRERGIPYEGHVDLNVPPAPSPNSNPSKSKKTWKYIVIGAVCGTVFVFAVTLLVFCLVRHGAHSVKDREENVNAAAGSVPVGGAGRLSELPINLPATAVSFTYEQLAQATSDFGKGNLIKQGHGGDLYHGVLENGTLIVVKRIDLSTVRKDMHLVELDFFSRFSHERLVTFLGHCLGHENEKFLVYREMMHRDLSNALYRKSAHEEDSLQSLDWITRLKIATGVAEALYYLHNELTPPLVHRDIQASSILLDDKFDVRLGSLSSICSQEGDGNQSVISRFFRLSQMSERSETGLPPASCAYDVYCFGKVLLELVTGKLGLSGPNGASTDEYLEDTLSHIDISDKELVTKIVDPSLVVDEDLLEEVWAMAIVARSCLNPKPSKRPVIKHILKALENPLRVVREDSSSGSILSGRSSWNAAAIFGSWRQSSRDVSLPGLPRTGRSLRHSGTLRSQDSGGEHSFSQRRSSKEIFPEP